MRHEGKDAVTVQWYSVFVIPSRAYSGGTGEAETGNAGEQPDQGIAGAELIADDEKGVVLPTRSFTWVAGPTIGRRLGPDPGFGFRSGHIGPIDSAIP